jgi:hypothetical protein
MPVPVATEKDVRLFRKIRSLQDRTQPPQTAQGDYFRTTLIQLNRAVGRLWDLRWSSQRAIQTAVSGASRYGSAVSEKYGTGIVTQFVQILTESLRRGIRVEDYYSYQLYLPERWRSRARQFPMHSQAVKAQYYLNKRDCPADFEPLQNKHLFAARCKEAGLPSVPTLAEFVDGHPERDFRDLPRMDLLSKPVNLFAGTGVVSWRYDQTRDCFTDSLTGQKFSRDALLDHLCGLSKCGRVILQPRLRNHPSLSVLTNGALSTIRLVTCRAPSGIIDQMPPVIRLPTGRSVVDNFAKGGLAAPVDLATGIVCGPALQKDVRLGVISHNHHPDTEVGLKGFSVPMWTEAVNLSYCAHKTFPSVHFVGWDIAVLQHGPVLVEANALFDTDLTVIPHGLTLSDTQFIPYYLYHWANSVR